MSRHDPARKPRHRPRAVRHEETLIYGTHAVEAALANPRRMVKKLWLTENAQNRLRSSIDARKVPTERVLPRDLDRRLGEETVHQGVLLACEPLPDVALADLAAAGGPIVVLDQVTDPHNVGAILRSAAVFGAAGLVMTRRHSPAQTGALAKAASGALDIVPIALVQNLAKALGELAELGFTRIGLDGGADMLLEDAPLERRIAIVVGAEGKGLRQLTGETCDHLCRIAAPGPIASLNVSNAAAVALHLIAMRRRKAGS